MKQEIEKDYCTGCGWEGYAYLQIPERYGVEAHKLCPFCAHSKAGNIGIGLSVNNHDVLIAMAQMFNTLLEEIKKQKNGE